MIEREIIDELKYYFSLFILNGKQEDARTVMAILFYAKNKNFFSKDFYQFWLFRFLTLRDGIGCFILSDKLFLNNVFELSLAETGDYVKGVIIGLSNISDSRVIPMLVCALEGGVVFDESWLCDVVALNFVLDEGYINKNRENNFNLLNNKLGDK